MGRCSASRRAQADLVPVIYARLDVEAATAEAIAATFSLPLESVTKALTGAEDAGYLRESDGVYRLTHAGRDASMTRGGARAAA